MAINHSNSINVSSGSSISEGVTYSTSAPTSIAGYNAGDTWYVTPLGTSADAANASAVYRFDGSQWVKHPIANESKLTYGTATPPTFFASQGAEYFVTSDGTSAGQVLEQWIYDGTSWVKRPSAPIEKYEKTTATALQTSYTLASVPVGAVHVTRNGVDISGAWTWVGAVGTYTPADNFNCTIDAEDLLQFHYEAY